MAQLVLMCIHHHYMLQIRIDTAQLAELHVMDYNDWVELLEVGLEVRNSFLLDRIRSTCEVRFAVVSSRTLPLFSGNLLLEQVHRIKCLEECPYAICSSLKQVLNQTLESHAVEVPNLEFLELFRLVSYDYHRNNCEVVGTLVSLDQ